MPTETRRETENSRPYLVLSPEAMAFMQVSAPPPLQHHEPGDAPDWFVLYVRPNGEAEVMNDLGEVGFAVYVPMSKAWVKPRHCKSKRLKEVSRPAFPGYVFVGVNPLQPDWRIVRGTDGVEAVLCCDNVPVRVAQSTIDDIHVAEDMGLFDEEGTTLAPLMTPGSVVTIKAGLLEGYEATVKRPPRDRLGDVLVDITGRSVLVPIDNLVGFD